MSTFINGYFSYIFNNFQFMISLDKEIVIKIVSCFTITLENSCGHRTYVLLITKCYEYDVIVQEMFDSIYL